MLLLLFACSSSSNDTTTPPTTTPPPAATTPPAPTEVSLTLDAEPQRAGDPAKGYRALVNEAYVPCGIPVTAYNKVFGEAPADQRVDGREGKNTTLAYGFTSFTTKDGVELVTQNCLSCHAGRIDGKLVVGLGNATGDFTSDPTSTAEAVGLFLSDPKEKAEWTKWKNRVAVIGPYSVLSTRGPNPADGFTATLFAHHDPKTMAWSDTALMDVLPPVDLPVDVPPWWRGKKKASMFYVGAGRGDHARIMMTASILCTSSVEESKAIDSYFPDIRAWIETLDAPKYTRSIDQGIANIGKTVFGNKCARCHGDETHYPNKLIGLTDIGTDGLLAAGSAQFGPPFTKWFGDSFFGDIARLEPQQGYVAPPLDGIWATAPFLHNGSVPTLLALLDSTQRPKFWTWSFDTKDFDEHAVGWTFTALDHGKDGEPDPDKKTLIYDTTKTGYSNAGHTYGDDMTTDERAAVIEYLKTL